MLGQIETALSKALTSVFGVAHKPTLTRTPNLKFGDVAWNCIPAAKAAGIEPARMATELATELSASPLISAVSTQGPYLNITVVSKVLFGTAVTLSGASGRIQTEQPKRVMVEYLSPNTNKPLHLGHVRNGVLGMALSNILHAAGHTVIKADLVNDRGIHICKSMLAYLKTGANMTPESLGKKPDHFVGDMYVKYDKLEKAAKEDGTDKKLEAELTLMLQKWEDGDPDTIALWEKMNGWVYEGFEKTMETYGFRFDKMYYESGLYKLGKDIVEDGLARGIFTRLPDGAVAYELPIDQFGTNPDGGPQLFTLLRANGTCLYTTQDLATAKLKFEEFALDRSIYVVGDEQDQHFKSLFSALGALGYDWALQCSHFSYGMVELPEGRMKSREGTVVDADDLYSDMVKRASAAISQKSGEQDDGQLARRGETLALAAIKFFLLYPAPKTTIVYDPAKSLDFEGETGAYCLYAYARIKKLLQTARMQGISWSSLRYPASLTDDDRLLALELLEFPQTVFNAAEVEKPAHVARKVLKLSRTLHRFYANQPVLTSPPAVREARLALLEATAKTIAWGLELLGIDVLEQM
ncbi:arginine--tRNA ligase [Patescibacteria group bacterium]|nr:arginine--tRNA ligase [Patescibacteria group bacterium]